MIRTHLVKSLYQNLLGPLSGPREIIEEPYLKYELGILNSSYSIDDAIAQNQATMDAEINPNVTEIKQEILEKLQSDNTQGSENLRQEVDTELNLKSGALSLGLSFVLEGGNPKFQICLTWARYVQNLEFGSVPSLFTRKPNFFVTDWIDASKKFSSVELKNDVNGSVVTHPGVILHVITKKIENFDKWTVKIFLENKSKYDLSKSQSEVDRVFQPQIRVKTENDILSDLDSNYDLKNTHEYDDDDLLYHNLRTKARGYLCAAVWHDVDPEKHHDGDIGKISWPDSEIVPQEIKTLFTHPDVRTEYLPLYSILQPDQSDKPTFHAKTLSTTWKSSDIESQLRSIEENYLNWIESQKKTLGSEKERGIIDKELKKIGEDKLEDCETSRQRIKHGVDFLIGNKKARAAFCFMNAVMNDKRVNETKDEENPDGLDLNWREFQMAFILQSLRGVTGESQDERDLADVLWFPTGGGKTEAYLGIVIFTIAYRRLSLDGNQNNDGGVNVISRYTLRLLTIQQFQRALGAIVAADIRRVTNWLPKEAIDGDEKISDAILLEKYDDEAFWGYQRFSIGMWIGGNITPKNFAMTTGVGGKKFLNCEGALLPQWHNDRKNSDEDNGPDPAQIQNCPICKNILCIPKDQKDHGSSKKFTWIIRSPKSIEDLNGIPKRDFEYQNQIVLGSEPVFELLSRTSDGMSYYRLTMEIKPVRQNQVLSRTLIDSWWVNFVKRNLDPDDEHDPLESTCPSMPGYFFLHNGSRRPYDFAIFCTNKSCELQTPWFEKLENRFDTLVPQAFQIPDSPNLSSSVPISAFISDEQVYSRCPSFLIATADKFANLPFEPRCASLFGNVDVVHPVFGYGRRIAYTAPIQKRSSNQRIDVPPEDLHDVRGFNPPSLILQDELHLIEGPLGSMVGIYEMAVDILSNNGSRPKYIASSATIKEAGTQVGTIFRRAISVFPSPGINSFDNHFSKIKEDISCTEEKFGRLYLGISSTKSTVYLPIKAQSIIMSEIFKIQNNPDDYNLTDIEKQDIKDATDPYWTFVSYFTDLQLLSKFTNYYPENIIENVSNWSSTKVPNSLIRLPNKSFAPGLKLFPLIPDRDMEVSSVSVFCVNKIGDIKIALYQDGTPIGELIYSSEYQDCRINENIFNLETEEPIKISKDKKIWIALINNNQKTVFQSVDIGEDSLEDKTFELTTDTFPNDFKDLSSVQNSSVKITLNSDPRTLIEEKNIQLSSETKPEDLTKYLEQLQEKFTIDSLQTSPVFGTGIDVDRLGVMQIMNQPKTNSGYIQSSGRVGRSNPGLVISWLRAGRARDLNHYENFVGYHRMLHKFVEPVTASPFSDEAMRLCLGPIMVAVLLNARAVSGVSISNRWVSNDGPDRMRQHNNDEDVLAVRNALAEISDSNLIAEYRQMPPERFRHLFDELKGLWHQIAESLAGDTTRPFVYHERRPDIIPQNNVVLGTPNHKDLGLDFVYDDTPNSLRQTESSSIFYGLKNDVTQIRPSQFTTRYGPGTLVSGKKSTWVIPPIRDLVSNLKDVGNFEQSNTSGDRRLYKYEINDSRMKRILHRFNSDIDWQKLKLFSLPTNSSLTVEEFKPLYHCIQFPRWAVCHNKIHPSRRILAEMTPDSRKGIVVRCPECQRLSADGDEKSTEFFNARYVLACCHGHLDDVNWPYEIHRSGGSCNGNVFEWISSGNNDNAEIVCLGRWESNDSNTFVPSDCNSSATYLELKGRSKIGQMNCSAKFAETGMSDPNGCPRPFDMSQAKMISKTQMSLRMPVISTTMEIQKYKGVLYELYEPLAPSIVIGISMLEGINPNWTKDDFIEKILQANRGRIRGITNQILRQTQNVSENVFREVIEDIKKFAVTLDDRAEFLSEYDSLEEELNSLEHQTTEHGFGAQIGPDDHEPDMRFPIQFTKSNLNFEAMPFGDIKVTQVQTGYTREISPPVPSESLSSQDEKTDGVRIGDVVTSNEKFTDDNGSRWYLGNQSRGEGIFIHLDPEKHDDAMDIFEGRDFDDLKTWKNIQQKSLDKNNPVLEELRQEESNEQHIDALEKENVQTNPLFVWWHSFAHELINQLSIDSGFMGVSLGERIYCIEKSNGAFGAGIFIYASSPGADGTLGGLTSLVNSDVLPRIVEKTLQKITTCSNDPVCSERKINDKRRTGSACHICLMNSETSCAYQNKFLDRNLVRGTL
jgi:hypothetical protein